MRSVVERYGRARVWAWIVGGCIGLVLLVLLSWMALTVLVRDEEPPPFDPAAALAQGGNTILVSAVCEDDDSWKPLADGSFVVLTHSGRQPDPAVGALVGNVAQFVVEADWIGQVPETAEDVTEDEDFDEVSEWIGQPFGWQDRVLVGRLDRC